MIAFLLSVASDVVASIIVAVGAWLSRRMWLTGFYSDIAKVYTSKARGLKAINKDIAKSNSVRILSVRGKSIVDSDVYASLWDSTQLQKRIEIITSSPDNDAVIIERSQANNTSRDEYRTEMQFAYNVLMIKKQEFQNLSIFQHMESPSFKLIILDQCLYVSYYLREKNVNKSRLIKYKSNNGAYDAFLHYYETTKKHSTEMQEGNA